MGLWASIFLVTRVNGLLEFEMVDCGWRWRIYRRGSLTMTVKLEESAKSWLEISMPPPPHCSLMNIGVSSSQVVLLWLLWCSTMEDTIEEEEGRPYTCISADRWESKALLALESGSVRWQRDSWYMHSELPWELRPVSIDRPYHRKDSLGIFLVLMNALLLYSLSLFENVKTFFDPKLSPTN